MRGPGVVNLDLSLFRKFRLTEKFKRAVPGGIFNLTIAPHFGNPNGNANSLSSGRILAAPTADALGRSREFRLGLRLGF
ncbi:MAG: hypothetical protein LC130_29740 [Bryobacterales bacterium]|nr:hypothetical protein [Bryobacterales bacterium]